MKKIFYTKLPIVIGIFGFSALVTWATMPTLTVVTPVPTYTNTSTPTFVFNSTETGTITYGGDCLSSTLTDAIVGDNTGVFDTLPDGLHSNCTITVTNGVDTSAPLAIPAFTVDTVSPTLSEVTPVTTPTNNSTPSYTFSGSEDATITYSGGCVSSSTGATTGNNTITFNTLSDGTYASCSLTLADAAGNISTPLNITSFTVDTTAPSVVLTSASGSSTNTSPILVTAQFNEPVTGFSTGGVGVGSGTLSNFVAVDEDTYTFDITPSAEGVVTVDIAGSVAQDAAGNNNTAATQLVVNYDTTSPVITLNGSGSITIEAGSSYTDSGAIWTDLPLNGSGSVVGSGTVDVNTVADYPITYDVTDGAGNVALQVTRTVRVRDTTSPVITLNGSGSITIEAGSSYTDAGAIWTDLPLNGSGSVVGSGTVDVNTVADYPITYDVTDGAGNVALQVTRTVRVRDTTSPVITLNGSGTVIVEAGSSYTDSGAIWTDLPLNGSGSLTASGTVNTLVPGVYTLRYNKTDVAGNVATQVIRTVTVVDTTAPVITLLGDPSPRIEIGYTYTESGAVWNDVVDGSGSLTASGSVNTNIPGTYILSYNKTDAAGNVAAQVTRTVVIYKISGGGGGSLPAATKVVGNTKLTSVVSTGSTSTGELVATGATSTNNKLISYTYKDTSLSNAQDIITSIFVSLSKKLTTEGNKKLLEILNTLNGSLTAYDTSSKLNIDKLTLQNSLNQASSDISKLLGKNTKITYTTLKLDSSYQPKKVQTAPTIVETPVKEVVQPVVVDQPKVETPKVEAPVISRDYYLVNVHAVKLTTDKSFKYLSAWMVQGDTVQILEDGEIAKVKIISSYQPRYVGKEGYIYKKHLKKVDNGSTSTQEVVQPVIEQPKVETPKVETPVVSGDYYLINVHAVKLTTDKSFKYLTAWMVQGDTVQILEDGNIAKVKIISSYQPRYVGKEGYIYKKHLKKAE